MSIVLDQLPKNCHFRFRVSVVLFPFIFRQPADHIVESVFFVGSLYVYFYLSVFFISEWVISVSSFNVRYGYIIFLFSLHPFLFVFIILRHREQFKKISPV